MCVSDVRGLKIFKTFVRVLMLYFEGLSVYLVLQTSGPTRSNKKVVRGSEKLKSGLYTPNP